MSEVFFFFYVCSGVLWKQQTCGWVVPNQLLYFFQKSFGLLGKMTSQLFSKISLKGLRGHQVREGIEVMICFSIF